ncbi:hypothetical protein IMG5_168450 [Ichthyophthirius multifiliis]|uniref:Uncharacterized protein n=1 Tax=Ichthyophthirius multifiliis TaxID=5932 RepID=G0R142_ICHMU|nr:hypothetical protein IMG5_168450 [Ichthyophthirius multifiliis]EGR28809.1 hypothetical protein IMG5_168450 [Ichthyophthirius multifiliis]|eukprot:XP_004030045.1 hypothetical protein IMG5_168450 [Ichthyophthirius multifiliis]
MNTNTFKSLNLHSFLLKICEKIEYKTPTKIQQLSIPAILNKKNVVINAETGSGKTAAFSFPILQFLSEDPRGIFAIVLTANRELALQISEQLSIFGSSLNLRVSTLVGGIDFAKQASELELIPHIIVGTPGRTADMLRKSDIFREYVENLEFLVLDEADRLFEEKVFTDIQEIIGQIPEKKQVILATATINEQDFCPKKLQKILCIKDNIEFFSTNKQKKMVQTVVQKYGLIPELVKDEFLINILEKYKETQIIIFTNKCQTCNFLHFLLKNLNFSNVNLHSKLKQSQRIAHLKTFRNQTVNILVSTDVASRGLDIPAVQLVINYDMPRNYEDYIHRVGRTARKGKRGVSISICTQFDVELLKNIEANIGEEMKEIQIDNEIINGLQVKVGKAKKIVKIQLSEKESKIE